MLSVLEGFWAVIGRIFTGADYRFGKVSLRRGLELTEIDGRDALGDEVPAVRTPRSSEAKHGAPKSIY